MKGTSQENSNRATTLPWSVRMPNSVMTRRARMSAQWHYQNGVILKAIEQVWLKTGDTKYWAFMKETLNQFIDPAGNIRTYSLVEYNFDQVNLGKMLFPAYKQTGDARYIHAVAVLCEQLRWQPHTTDGGFWYKQSTLTKCGSRGFPWRDLFMPNLQAPSTIQLLSTM